MGSTPSDKAFIVTLYTGAPRSYWSFVANDPEPITAVEESCGSSGP